MNESVCACEYASMFLEAGITLTLLNLKPGTSSSVTTAPPSTFRRSRTHTDRPARARYAAAHKPLWPPVAQIVQFVVIQCGCVLA